MLALLAALSVTATPLPGGSVRLSWPATRGRVHIERTASAANEAPVATFDVMASEAWLDARAPEGVTCYYVVTVGGEKSAPVAVTIPARPLPPLKKPMLRIDKHAYVLSVVDGGKVVRRYPIALGGQPTRRKLCFDNASTPEGIYHIAAAQPRATYYRAYDLDYPTALDRARYTLARTPLFPPIGGEIQIHGRGIDTNWTFGYIALRNEDMDELFSRPALGRGTEVRIWGGELTEAEVDAMAKPPANLAKWHAALKTGASGWGPELWEALGRFQRAQGLAVTCQPDAATARKLGLKP